MLDQKGVVRYFPVVQNRASDKAEGGGKLEEADRAEKGREKIGNRTRRFRMHGIKEPAVLLTGSKDSFLHIFICLPAHELGFKQNSVILQDPVCEFVDGIRAAVPEQVEKEKMQHDVVVGKASGFPDPVEGVGVKKVAVQRQRNGLSLRAVFRLYVFRQPRFNPASLIVIGPAAFYGKIISGFKTVDQEIADIVPAFLKGFDQFLEFGHGVSPLCSVLF